VGSALGHGDDVGSGEARAELLTLPFLPFGLFGFLLFGAVLVLVGASLDDIRAQQDLDLTRAGLLVSSLMTGLGIGVLAGGPLVDRLPRRPLFFAAASATGAALLAVAPDQGFWTLFALLVVAGAGGGLFETILNTVAIDRYGRESVRMVSLLHSGASVGAMLTPLAILWWARSSGDADWTVAFRVTGALHLLLALLATLTPLGSPIGAAARSSPESPGRILTPTVILLCVACFAYVGVESALTGLAIPYARGALELAPDRGRSAISVFWLGLLAGRLLFAARAGGLDDARAATVMGGIAGALLAFGVGFAWGALELMLAGVGLALGGCFPLLVTLAGRWTPQAPATGVSVVAGVGSAGGFAVPWLTGFVGDAAGVAFAVGTLALWSGVIAVAALLAQALRVRRVRR
jgi:FHS family glucose/mannose:H+ symporter-like MFS transporter